VAPQLGLVHDEHVVVERDQSRRPDQHVERKLVHAGAAVHEVQRGVDVRPRV
jgi:hypothetical protein